MAWIRCIGNRGGSLKLNTASGAIATFNTNIVDLLQSVKCSINPIQDLHGEDRPYPAGGGVNLWDEEWELGEINSSGVLVPDSSHLASTNYIRVAPNTNYRLVGIRAQVAEYDAQKTFIGIVNNGYIGSNGGNVEFTTSATTMFLRFNGASSYGTTYNNDVSINYPATDTTYHPYENICPISGHTEANITRCGVNLWGGETLANDFSEVADYTKDTANKTFTFSHRVGADQTIIGATRFKPNTRYTFIFRYTAISENSSLRIVYSDNSRTAITFPTANTKSDVVVTSTASKTIVAVIMSYYTDGLTTVYYDESGLFEGVKTVADFTPYNGQTYAIAFGQTVYGGVLDVTRGKLHVTWGSVDLGSLNWASGMADTIPVYVVYDFNMAKAPSTNAVVPNIITSIYKTVSRDGLVDTNENITLSSINILMVATNRTYANAAAFKTAMSGVYLACELATPFDIDLTPVQISALVLPESNNVFADCGGDTEVKYLTLE